MSKATWKLVQESIRITEKEIQRHGGRHFLADLTQAGELVSKYGPDTHRLSRLTKHFRHGVIPQEWPGKLIGLEWVRISGESSFLSVAQQLDIYYRTLLSHSAPPLEVPEWAVMAVCKLRIPAAVFKTPDSSVNDDAILVMAALEQAALHLVQNISQDLDTSIWAGHVAGASEWSDYSLGLSGLVKRDDGRVIPAPCLENFLILVAEAEDEAAQDKINRLHSLSAEMHQISKDLACLNFENDDEGADAEISFAVADMSQRQLIHERSIQIVGNGIEVTICNRVFGLRPDRVQVSGDSDALLDKEYLHIGRKTGQEDHKKVLSSPISDHPMEDPLISTRLVFHLSVDGSLWVKASRGSVEYARVDYCPGNNGSTKQAKLFLLLLGKFQEGLSLKEVLQEIYEDDISRLNGGGMDAHRLIVNVRSLMSDTVNKAVAAGFDKRIFPQAWGKKSHSVQLHLNVASVICASPKSFSPGSLKICPLRENDQSI